VLPPRQKLLFEEIVVVAEMIEIATLGRHCMQLHGDILDIHCSLTIARSPGQLF
jgi:hypothetical protein